MGPKLVDTLPTGNLTTVAIFIDLAMKKQNIPKLEASTKSAIAAYDFSAAYGLRFDPNYRVDVV